MSFLIAVYVNEGILLASDRRTTYSSIQSAGNTIYRNFGIHVTNSTDKTFICPNGAGISTCGDSSILGKPITGYIRDMIRTQIIENCYVKDIPQIIIDYFNELPTVPDTNFLIAGYDETGKKQMLYKVNVKSKDCNIIDTANQGATWDGEIVTLSRLIQKVAIKEETENKKSVIITDDQHQHAWEKTTGTEKRIVGYEYKTRTHEWCNAAFKDPKTGKLIPCNYDWTGYDYANDIGELSDDELLDVIKKHVQEDKEKGALGYGSTRTEVRYDKVPIKKTITVTKYTCSCGATCASYQ